MEVPRQPEREARLAKIAAQRGVKTDELVRQLLVRYLEDDTRLVEAINLGIAVADRGDFVEQEAVGKKLKEIIRP